ncbi:MAG TPA: carboxypeptidase-like regulatory domain-containing protein, partial [Candidatus Methylomirabilis sp.]|nr:carboxypeptidase-like regulatory domain-containing protein [Candidatus Methylomirabilis sp.]
MNKGQVRVGGALVLGVVVCLLCSRGVLAQFKPAQGILSGIVHDASGVPQMGASVEVIPESAPLKATPPLDLFTNTRGVFRGEKLAPGFYTVRVTLAGFLPSLERHVRINANFTTLVRIQLESVFATLEQLRRAPSSNATEADDWKWVLRSAVSTRPVLEWTDPDPLSAVDVGEDPTSSGQPRGRLEFTDGARRPGSVSNLPASPATAFAYDQPIGDVGRLLLAGLMNADTEALAGGVATVWLPTGSLEAGPHTAVVLRESKLGVTGPTFRAARVEQGGSLSFGNRAVLQYGGEYVLVGLGRPASSLRPRMELDARLSDDWQASLIFAAMPAGPEALEAAEGGPGSTLAAALNELDAFPVLMWRDGRPVLESGFHEELAAERKLGKQGKVQLAAFHQDNSHSAVFGRGTNLPVADFFQDVYANGFAYDGGSSSTWGTRVAYRESLSNGFEVTAVYAFAGTLAPSANPAAGALREMFRTVGRQSVGAKVSRKVVRSGTRFSVGYEWISGPTLTRVDGFGESLFDIAPYLHLGVHQQLPKFGRGRWEANAECDNLLAQGYITLNSPDGRVTLMPAFRT